MFLPGRGLLRASCRAYRNVNGVAAPETSAGSRYDGAIVVSKAMVSWPSAGLCARTFSTDTVTSKKETRTVPTTKR